MPLQAVTTPRLAMLCTTSCAATPSSCCAFKMAALMLLVWTLICSTFTMQALHYLSHRLQL